MARREAPARLTFQSTPPRGGRLVPPPRAAGALFVSIHAPARGATQDSQLFGE